jgi:hypothetical protein
MRASSEPSTTSPSEATLRLGIKSGVMGCRPPPANRLSLHGGKTMRPPLGQTASRRSPVSHPKDGKAKERTEKPGVHWRESTSEDDALLPIGFVQIGPLFRKRLSSEPVADESCDGDPEEGLTIRAIGPIVREDGTISSPVVGGIKRLAALADRFVIEADGVAVGVAFGEGQARARVREAIAEGAETARAIGRDGRVLT